MDTFFVYTLFPFALFMILAVKLLSKSKRNIPPTAGFAFPIIGHLHLIKQPLYRTLQEFSTKYGQIFSMRLGKRNVVVVSSPSLVEECFTKNDVVFANRPRYIVGKYIGYNYTGMSVAPYGDHWRNLRKLGANEIFSPIRLNMFLSVRRDEVNRLLRKLCDDISSSEDGSYTKVELKSRFSELTFNVIMRMMTGKRFFGEEEGSDRDVEEAKRFRQLIRLAFELGGNTHLEDFLPILRTINKSYEKRVSKAIAEMDTFLQGLIEEHHHVNNNNTMIGHLLSLQEKQSDYYTDELIKALVMALLLAGTDTSTATVEWAMSNLLNNPQVLKKAMNEIDQVVGNDRLVDESDLSRLPYLHNIISETLRLFPPFPLLLAHESSDDCKLGGYDVPRGTLLIVNAWAIHRDPKVWDDPQSFKPERFEGSTHVDTTKLLPFGMGRRSCPGTALAQRVVGLTLGSLIQCFHWRRVGSEMVDLTAGEGLTLPKEVPLEAMCEARTFAHKVLSSQRTLPEGCL